MLNVLAEEEAATGPYGLHQLLLEQLMGFYDAGVWSIARTIRESDRHSETLNVSSGLDRRFNQMIAALAREDSASMKAIAYVTMTFLPATFVSALLGMNFFNFSPDEHQGHITYSHDLWIYFVISIAFTLIMFVLYWIWQQFRKKARARSNIEDEDAAENAYSTVEKEHLEKTRPRGSYFKGSRMIPT
ncbi:hypothetical protein KCU65_g3768, partial [Aureobasidium melanogenum]